MPTPTANTTYGRLLYVSNVGSVSFILGTATINPGAATSLIWSHTTGGDSWQFAGADAGNLQGAYNNSTGGSTSEIILDSTRSAVDIQDRSTSNGGTTGANLFNVRATAANDTTAGALLFGIGNTGATTFQNSVNSTSALQIQNAAGAALFNIDTSSTNGNLITNSSIETSALGTTWTYSGTPGSVARDTTQTYIGSAALKLITASGAVSGGVIGDSATQTLSTTLAASTTYYLSWYHLLTPAQ